MTIDDFNKEYGADFRKLRGKNMFTALVAVLDNYRPSKRMRKETLANVLAAGNIMFAMQQEYEHMMYLLTEELGGAPEENEDTALYQKDPEDPLNA